MRHVDKNVQKDLAKERIHILFKQAADEFSRYPARSHRYVEMARALSMKYKVRMPKEFRLSFCKECLHYLVSGKNASIRVKKNRVIISCKDCGHIKRIPTN